MTEIKIKIDGMMCEKCENRVNEAIKRNLKVKKVISSHKDKLTTIICKDNYSDEQIKNTISETGYTILEISRSPYNKKHLFGLKIK